MKDVMSSIDIAAITLELEDKVIGQRIDNVYHIIPKTFILRLRPTDLRLLVEVERRIHLTRFNYPVPQRPSNFCMALRKNLVGGTLESVDQYEFERIVNLKISTREGDFLLVSELFRRGSLILVGPDDRVRLSLRYARMRDRQVIRNEPYQPAPSSGLNPLKTGLEELQTIKQAADKTLLKALTSLISLGPLHCREVLVSSGLEVEMPAKDLTQTQLEAIAESISRLKRRILEREIEPSIVHDERDLPLDVIPFPLKIYEGKPSKKFKTYNEAADEYFSTQAASTELERTQTIQREETARLERILRQQTERKRLLEEAVIKNRRRGDLIYQNLHTISGLMDLVRGEKERGTSLQEIGEAVKQKASNFKPEMRLEVLPEEFGLDMEETKIRIRLDRSPQQAAQGYYDAAKRAAQKLKGLGESVREIESRLKSIATTPGVGRAEARIPTRMREKAWYEKFHWFRSSDGLLVLSGKDASTNDLLVRRYLTPNDIVFHAEIHGAPFTVVKTEEVTVPERTLIEAAQASAARSKAWSLGLTSLDVYWVKAKQVGTKPPSGEYLGKGQFMVTGRRNYIRGVESRIAVGIRQEEAGLGFVAGPPSAIKKQAEAYVELVPGRTPAGILAKKIVEILKAKSPESIREKLNRISIDEVARLIPAGKGDIVDGSKTIP